MKSAVIYGGARGQNGSPNCVSHAQLVELFPESERDFFTKSMDIWMTFETDTEGRATALILHTGGANLRAKRIDALTEAKRKKRGRSDPPITSKPP